LKLFAFTVFLGCYDRGYELRFILRFFIAFFVLFVVWIGIVFFQTGRDTRMSQWVYDVYVKKTAIADGIKGKKLVIVAGSNALFGCDSKMLSEAFDIPVVNYGVNAGVYLPYILYKARGVINSGDIVVLPLEYSMYNYDGVPNIQMIDYIFSRDRDAFFSLSAIEQFYMVWNITFKRLYDGYMTLGGTRVTAGLYGAHNVDRYGDQIGATKKAKSQAIVDELNRLKANHFGEEYNKDSLGWKYIEKFVKWCDARGVKTVFMPSTLLKFDSYFSEDKERWFYENLANEVRKKGWVYVGNPYDYMYDIKYYFNTDFHLTDEGRKMRTKRMIFDLKSTSYPTL